MTHPYNRKLVFTALMVSWIKSGLYKTAYPPNICEEYFCLAYRKYLL